MSISASKTGVLSLQGRPSLFCVLRVGVRVLRTINSDVEQSSGRSNQSSSVL